MKLNRAGEWNNLVLEKLHHPHHPQQKNSKMFRVPSPRFEKGSYLSMDFVAVDAVISEFYICKCRIRCWVVNWMVSQTRFIDLETLYIYIYIEGKQPWAVMSSDVSQSSPSAEIWGHREQRQSESSKRCRFVPPGTCCVPMRLRMKQIRSSPGQWHNEIQWAFEICKPLARWR